ncbi:hypothetical protein J3459_013009 [Metarhizium acridum]|nr:hypothetical protein J3459_013009 [Metarhizium acridum]
MHSLGIFNYKIYVSTSSRLLPMIQKQSKSLSFRPFLQITARKHGDASDKTYEIYGGDLTYHLSHAVRTSLAPGPHLDEQNLRMGKRVLIEIDDLLNRGGPFEARNIHLLEWKRHLVVQASSCGVCGDQHPLLDPKGMAEITAHLAGLDIFGKRHEQRKVVYDAYTKYFRELPNDGSELAREHKRVIREAGVDELDYAKQASLFTIAVFSNTAPTFYWTVWEVFSRPGILAEIRDEVETHAVTRPNNDGRYLLKAGNFIQMPGHLIHSDTSLWEEKGAAALPPSGFVAWGAPPHLCPARQFATVEVLIATALLVVRPDLQPHGDAWDKFPALNYKDLSTLLNPRKDVCISVGVSDNWVGKWSLEMGESRSRVPLASG